MTSFNIILISDIHAGDNDLYSKKKKLTQHLINTNFIYPNNNIIVIAGDLTHNGYGKSQCLCFSCCLCLNMCCSNANSNSNKSDEVNSFEEEIFLPLIKTNSPILLCHGNHDESGCGIMMSFPVLDFIKTTIPHGIISEKGFYTYVYQNITFVVLGKYPDQDGIQFFEKVHRETPIKKYIVIFHYQLESTDQYDFWTRNEKDDFLQCCENKDIICIIHGHIHRTYANYVVTPGNKKIYTFCGASESSYAILNITNQQIGNFTEVYVPM